MKEKKLENTDYAFDRTPFTFRIHLQTPHGDLYIVTLIFLTSESVDKSYGVTIQMKRQNEMWDFS